MAEVLSTVGVAVIAQVLSLGHTAPAFLEVTATPHLRIDTPVAVRKKRQKVLGLCQVNQRHQHFFSASDSVVFSPVVLNLFEGDFFTFALAEPQHKGL